jgi:hypothetical protein
MPETINPRVAQQAPFSHVTVLKNPPPIKIMLAHCVVEALKGLGNQAIGLFQLSESQVEGLFIAMEILEIKVRILIKPKGEP